MKKKTLAMLVSISVLEVNSHVAWAETDFWNCADNFWGANACWLNLTAPTKLDSVYLRPISLGGGLYGDGTLRLGAETTAGAANRLEIDSDGKLRSVGFIQSGGSLAITTLQIVGVNGTGSYTLSNGTNTAELLNLASGPSGNGAYSLLNGVLASNRESIGTMGTGTFMQSGGTNTVATTLIVGHNASGNGTYRLVAGSLAAGAEYVGYTGTGTFEQVSGTHTTSTLTLGYQHAVNLPPSSGTFRLGGGSLIVSDNEIIGSSGRGTFEQTGGSHSAKSLTFADNSLASSGGYSLTNGSLTVNFDETIGRHGAGSFTQSGGTHTAKNLKLAEGSGSGSYAMNGGSLSVANNETIGRLGAGTFTQTGGTHTVGNTITLHAKGTYNLTGGTLSAATIAFSGGGAFDFTGGTLAVGHFRGSLVNAGGTLAPGASPGVTTIWGDYSQSVASAFSAEIGGLIAGTQYDQLNVDGTAVLDGKLQVSLYGSFVPQAGSYFDILTAEVILGSFASFESATLGSGLAWQVSYLQDVDGTSLDVVRLRVAEVAAPVPEPRTYAMLLAGLGMLGFMLRLREERRGLMAAPK